MVRPGSHVRGNQQGRATRDHPAPCSPGAGDRPGAALEGLQGPFFNNPHVNADRFKIERRIIDTIRHTPKGETIRIAVYSFDRMGSPTR